MLLDGGFFDRIHVGDRVAYLTALADARDGRFDGQDVSGSLGVSGLSENFTPLRRNGPVSRLNFRNYLFFNAQKFMARLMLKFWRVKNQCT